MAQHQPFGVQGGSFGAARGTLSLTMASLRLSQLLTHRWLRLWSRTGRLTHTEEERFTAGIT